MLSSLSARRVVAAIAVLASALVLAVAVAQAYNPRLDDADALLEKAALQLSVTRDEQAQAPLPTKQAQAQFDKALVRAIAATNTAREEIAKAKAIAGP